MPKDKIARYEIQSELGQGGMAVVYLAYDPNFRRQVAIKWVSVNFQDQQMFRSRFEREARLIARIEHPAIVPVYDFGEQDDQPYLVMRYMPGGSLASKIKDGPVGLREAARVVDQIAPALDAVHAQGIVHRDLKPANILFDGYGNAAVSDFGIAHFSAATMDLTGSAIIGTPSYMSPEQVRGETLDGRSDVYALGVVLFEMLAGTGLFRGASPMSVAWKHVTEPAPPVRSFRPDLPTEVENVLNKALAKDREARYSRASELALALRRVADSFPEETSPAARVTSAPRPEEKSTEVDVATMADSGSLLDAEHRSQVEHSEQASSYVRSPAAPPVMPSRRPAWMTFPAAAGAGLSLLIFCGLLAIFGIWAGLRLPDLFAFRNQTTPPTLTAAPITTSENIVLFSDDFSNPSSGWPTLSNEQGSYRYQADAYHVLADQIDSVFWAKTNREDSDIRIRVTARMAPDKGNGYYGLLCRMQDDRNFYYFVIQPNGDFTIGKYKEAVFQSLFPEGWRQSGVTLPAGQPHQLEADCSANRLRFFVNNTMLGEATDADFAAGFSGLLVAALDAQGFEVVFDDFVITTSNR